MKYISIKEEMETTIEICMYIYDNTPMVLYKETGVYPNLYQKVADPQRTSTWRES